MKECLAQRGGGGGVGGWDFRLIFRVIFQPEGGVGVDILITLGGIKSDQQHARDEKAFVAGEK